MMFPAFGLGVLGVGLKKNLDADVWARLLFFRIHTQERERVEGALRGGHGVSGFRVWGLGFRVQGLGLRVEGPGLRVWGSGCGRVTARKGWSDEQTRSVSVKATGSHSADRTG